MSDNFTFNGVTFESFTFKNGKGLVTKMPESEDLEYKGFGKLGHFDDKSKAYQPKELKETIAAFLNTKGGSIYLGVHNKNGFLYGGDYTLEDKDKLGVFLKNLAAALGIAGLGLIEHMFYKIPKSYQLPCADRTAERCLAVIIVHKSPFPIMYDNTIIIREMNTNTKLSMQSWELRNSIQQARLASVKKEKRTSKPLIQSIPTNIVCKLEPIKPSISQKSYACIASVPMSVQQC